VRASKSPKPGSKLLIGDVDVLVSERDGDLYVLEFGTPVLALLEQVGEVPLPPYLERSAEASDRERYQTVYARDPGAVAAPTAGLHFDADMLAETRQMGVQHAWVTLHVGAGTFQALREEDIAKNRLHSERVELGDEVCEAVRQCRRAGGRVVAVGTTSVRALESASATGELRPYQGETDLFILPGYQFRSVDAVLTNFHLPRSSLLMLVAAFAGSEPVLRAYEHAVRERYRFFSYGDAMFLTPGSAS
jgi:S-adenosylmethionine:tRNA ribosyltransferase-isomerase